MLGAVLCVMAVGCLAAVLLAIWLVGVGLLGLLVCLGLLVLLDVVFVVFVDASRPFPSPLM